jgi:hypothetical protein
MLAERPEGQPEAQLERLPETLPVSSCKRARNPSLVIIPVFAGIAQCKMPVPEVLVGPVQIHPVLETKH